jgi:hypothetical protein
MNAKHSLLISVIPLAVLLTSCASNEVQDNIGASAEATAESYGKYRSSMGAVLLDAMWARQWKCGRYENAQLVSFSFDRMPLNQRPDKASADLVVGTTSRLAVDPKFVSLALLVPPGEYALRKR